MLHVALFAEHSRLIMVNMSRNKIPLPENGKIILV